MCIGTLAKVALSGLAGAAAIVVPTVAYKTGKGIYAQAKENKKVVNQLNAEGDEINNMIDELNSKGFNL